METLYRRRSPLTRAWVISEEEQPPAWVQEQFDQGNLAWSRSQLVLTRVTFERKNYAPGDVLLQREGSYRCWALPAAIFHRDYQSATEWAAEAPSVTGSTSLPGEPPGDPLEPLWATLRELTRRLVHLEHRR